MTLLHYYAGALVSGAVSLAGETGFSARAAIGQVDTCRVIVDDPGGTLDFAAYKTWRQVEDAAPVGRQTAWYGYVGDTYVGRTGGAIARTTGPSRVWELELIECNGYLSRRIITAASANRVKETVSARITWLLTQPGFAGVIADHGLVEASTVSLDAANYQGRTGADVLRDCALASGFNFFIRYREASADMELVFIDSVNSTADPALLSISNVAADVNLTTVFPPAPEARKKSAAGRIAAGIHVAYNGGSVYVDNPTTAATFAQVDQPAPTASVTSLSAATALANRLLAQHAEADVTMESIRLLLPAANLNDVRQGQRLPSVRMSHMPGYTAGKPMRVNARTFGRASNLSQGVYEVDLALGSVVSYTCTYTPNSGPSTPSSLDVWGAFVGGVGTYNAAGVPPTPTQTISGGPSLYGTCNNGAGFGVSAGVFSGYITVNARWSFDLGVAKRICTAQLIGTFFNSAEHFLEYSNDGVTWASAIVGFGGAAQSVGNINARYWSMRNTVTVGNGGLFYYAGVDLSGWLIWEAV